jgi:hypothetical protein
VSNEPDRLTSLLELASQGTPETRRELAFDLTDLLLDWPAKYAQSMREPFDALLLKVARDLDGHTRDTLVARLAESAQTPLDLLNEFFFDVPAGLKTAILARTADAFEDEPTSAEETADCEASLVAAVRKDAGSHFAPVFAGVLGIDAAIAAQILDDPCALAAACKGAGLGRPAFSTLTLLTRANGGETPEQIDMRLRAFDDVSEPAARRLLGYWRARHGIVHERVQERDAQAA